MQKYANNNQDASSSMAELEAQLRATIRETVTEPEAAPQSNDRPPLDVLPTAARLLIEEAETALGIHPAYSMAGMIFAAAAAVGATHQVQVKKGCFESPCFYMAMVGIPNSNKSGGLKFGIKPIQDRDSANFELYRAELNEYKKAEKEGTQTEEEPVLKKTVMTDYSRESLATKHLDNLRGLAVIRDELMGWINDMNRYSGGGEEQFYLENWSGNPITVDRKGQRTVRIKNPVISVAGTIQPGPLKSLTGKRAENGFAHRILFVWPEIKQKPPWNQIEIPESLVNQYASAIDKLQDLEFKTADDELGEGWNPKDNPHILRFSPGAQKLIFSFFNEVNNQLCDFAENDYLRGMHGKFDVHAQRLALVLQMLWYGYGEEGREIITEATAKRAIKLSEWFRSQSEKVYCHLYESGPLDNLTADERRVYEALTESFKTNELVFTTKATINKSKRTAQNFLKKWVEENLVVNDRRGVYSKMY